MLSAKQTPVRALATRRGATSAGRMPFKAPATGGKRTMVAPRVAEAAVEQELASDITLQSWELDVLDLDAVSFFNFIESTDDRLVVVDYYAQWCGPCKAMAPFIQELAATMDPRKVLFAKVDCEKNRALAKELGLRALPTFHIWKGRQRVAEVTGTRRKELVALIEEKMAALL